MPYLVLSRKVGEVIRIDDNIDVMVVSFDKDAVRLGVSAPNDIPVHRLEVFEAIQRENEATVDD